MMISIKPSILLSIFRRKGGEGKYTFVINENNNKLNNDLLVKLGKDEICLIAYYRDHFNWCMLTDMRLVACIEQQELNLTYSQIRKVDVAMEEEYKDRIMDKALFTKLRVKDDKNKIFILELEAGKPYWGLFQVLHRVATDD